MPAHDILSGALDADPELKVGAYAFLNLLAGNCRGGIKTLSVEKQMAKAMAAVGDLKPSLKFVAIDIEHGYYDGTTKKKQMKNVEAIKQAIDILTNSPYNIKRIVIYAGCNDWVNATGNDTTIAGSGLQLWNTRGVAVFLTSSTIRIRKMNLPCFSAKGITPWTSFGGWSGRLEKANNMHWMSRRLWTPEAIDNTLS